MTLHLGQSSILPINPYHSNQTVTKKISNYIFKFQDKIGQGNFSKVYKGYHQLTNQLVAIKIVQLSSVKSAKLQQLLFSQIEVIQSLNHPNILKCHQVLKSQNNCYIITELCDGGDLQSLLKKQKCLNQFSAAPYISDIFKGLLYLGQRGIVHRDLKVANIFLHKGKCKLADFGFAKYTNNQNFYDMDIGSPLYMSPQGMIDHFYGMKTDVWSFGIIIYQLLHGKTPFSYCTSQFQLKRVAVTPLLINNLRPDISIQVKQLILKCLVVNYNHRSDALGIVNDPYLKSIMTQKSQMKINVPHQIDFHNSQRQNQITSNHNIIINSSITTNIHPQSQNHLQVLSPQHAQKNIPLEFNLNSPNRTINKQNSKQPSLNGNDTKSKKAENSFNINLNGTIQKKLQYSPSIQNYLLKNHQSNQDQKNYLNPANIVNNNVSQSNKSCSDKFSPDRYNRNAEDHILTPQQLQKRIHSKSIKQMDQSFDNASNSSWSHENCIKKNKFSKVLSYQNIIKNNNLVNKSIQSRKTIQSAHNTTINASNSMQNVLVKNLQTSKNSNNSSYDYSICNSLKSNQLSANNQSIIYKQNYNQSYNNQSLNINHQSSNSNITQSFNNNINQPLIAKNAHIKISQLPMNNNKSISKLLSFKQQNLLNSSKKFGQLIKGQKKPQGNVKNTVKVQKNQINSNPNDKNKTKSQIRYQPTQILYNDGLDINKKREAKHSIGQVDFVNQFQSLPANHIERKAHLVTQRNQLHLKIPLQRSELILRSPQTNQNQSINRNQQKNQINNSGSSTHSIPSFLAKKPKQQLEKNIICTVIQFKQAVGFLHYCRLYFRFLTGWKKILTMNQVHTLDIFKSVNKNQQIYQIYSEYLLTALNQLINNIKLKQIIYNGQNYKKKRLKEDKLKEVTQEYFKKYSDEINKSRTENKRIQPIHNNHTSIEYAKSYNQELWQKVDQQYFLLMEIKKKQNINESFIAYFRNLCYFGLRINEANYIISSCVHIKNYQKLADAIIQNWLSQQYYTEQQYFKLKNQYFKRLAESNVMKGSQTNDTEDNCRHENL